MRPKKTDDKLQSEVVPYGMKTHTAEAQEEAEAETTLVVVVAAVAVAVAMTAVVAPLVFHLNIFDETLPWGEDPTEQPFSELPLPPPPELLAGFQPARRNTVHGTVFDLPKTHPAAVPAAVNESRDVAATYNLLAALSGGDFGGGVELDRVEFVLKAHCLLLKYSLRHLWAMSYSALVVYFLA